MNCCQITGSTHRNLKRKRGRWPEGYGKYERGESSPSVDVASRIAAALEVSLDYLVAGTTSDLDDLDDGIIARARELAALPDDERRPVLAVLDAYLRDVRIRRAYA